MTFLPEIFKIDSRIIDKIEIFLEQNIRIYDSIIIVSGPSHSKRISEKINFAKIQFTRVTVESNSFHDVQALINISSRQCADLLIAVGGGKVLDVVKRASLIMAIDNIVVPTIISHDGLISPIAVIENDFGQSQSLPGRMPSGVIIDIDVVMSAPTRYIAAAAGDILSNISATNDWLLANNKTKEPINDLSFHLSRGAATSLVVSKTQNYRDQSFLMQLILGQVNSGIAMSIAGTSRPCSGSEHLLSHAMEFLRNVKKNVLHGSQVASTSLFTLYLQDKLSFDYLEYARVTGVELNFTNLLIDKNQTNLLELFECARIMRPGRVTVLDNYNNNELLTKFISYEAMLLNMGY